MIDGEQPDWKISRRTFLAAGAAAALGSRASASAMSPRYRVPIEGVPHTRTWMAWPDGRAIWGKSLPGVQADIARIAKAIAKYEEVIVCANPGGASHAQTACGRRVEVIDQIPVDDCWTRDTGPIFRVDGAGGLDAVGLNFNGWGGKQTHARDALVAGRIAALAGVPFTAASFVSEGGAIETDGAGTLIATQSSILNRNRNPGRTRAQIEAAMCAAYGASKVIWFPGIAGRDITDDHVDATSRFLGGAHAIVQYPARASDRDIWSNDERRQYHILSRSTDAHGWRVRVTKLRGPVWGEIRQRANPDFVASYANYFLCNGAVIAAQFGDPDADAAARAALARAFPDRVVEQLNIDHLGNGGGGVHCVTQPQPIRSGM